MTIKTIVFISIVAAIIASYLIRNAYWRGQFPTLFGKQASDCTTADVFKRLEELRGTAEHSDPRFRRPGFEPVQPYLGWLDLADANWRDYNRAKKTAQACGFL